MAIPSASQLLDAWEGAASASPTRRALALLALACPETPPEALAGLPIGRRDAALMQLRACLFGASLAMRLPCPCCGEALEAAILADRLAEEVPAHGEAAQCVESGGYRVRFRLPTSADLLTLAPGMALPRARAQLLARCVLEAHDATGVATEAAALPAAVARAVAEGMAACDPQAELRLDFSCPACRHRWESVFDIAHFLWCELHAWAQRTLLEVHALARAYGWREPDVLALSPTRRQAYLELCQP